MPASKSAFSICNSFSNLSLVIFFFSLGWYFILLKISFILIMYLISLCSLKLIIVIAISITTRIINTPINENYNFIDPNCSPLVISNKALEIAVALV